MNIYHLGADGVRSLPVRFPSISEQEKVADFLERETARFDSLIDTKLRIAHLLHDRRASLLRESFLFGSSVDNNNGGNDLMSQTAGSGLPVARLKRVATELIAGGTPRTENPAYWELEESSGMPWVTIGDMVEGGMTVTTSRRLTSEGLAASRLHVGVPGTILLAMYASVGKTSVLGVRACWNQAILGIVPRADVVLPAYLSLWLEFVRPHLEGIVRSNTQENLNAEQVGNLPLVLPPIERQRELVSSLTEDLSRLERLVARIERQVDLLNEHRQALITAAVSGQVETSEDAHSTCA